MMVKKSLLSGSSKLRKFSSTCSLTESNIVVLGDGKVGKSSILKRFVEQKYVDTHVPTISDVFEKCASLKDVNDVVTSYSLRLFDTAGSMAFPAVNRITISQGCAFVIVYSVDSVTSFETAVRLFNEISEIKNHRRFPCVLVGNKNDASSTNRKVSSERALQLAVAWKAAFVEVSAKEDSNINDIFTILVRKMEAAELYENQTTSLNRRYSAAVSASPFLCERKRKPIDGPCRVM